MVRDHKDGNGLNNQKDNLRICTKSQNGQNRRKKEGCSSQFVGVTWSKKQKRWVAQIGIADRMTHLGSFIDERAAASAYNKAAVGMFGESAKLNRL